MECIQKSENSISDNLEILTERRNYGLSANGWLVQQGIQYLNSSDKESEVAYKHVIELLSLNAGSETIVQLLRKVAATDISIKWSLLYLLGDIADRHVGKWLAQYSITPLPERGEGCEGPRDTELLLRTMAIESLKKIATLHREESELFFEIISKRPDRAVLIEAVKAATELGLGKKLLELLPKEDHWVLDIRKARIEEVHADPERVDTKERSFTPPKMASQNTSPSVKCECKKGGTHHG